MLALQRPTAAKGSARGTRVRKRGRGKKGTAVDSNGLQDPHLAVRPPSLAHPDLHFNTVLRHITYRNVFCALLSKTDRQAYVSLFSS